jgi:fructuronate reductase
MTRRLNASARLPVGVVHPRWDRASTATGIVHLGAGAFHRAHQAVYTDDAMEASGGEWMITGVSLRSADVARALNPQDGLYTVLVRAPEGVTARVIGCIRNVLVAPEDPRAVLDALVAPETRIVSLTITEKGYGLDPKSGGLDCAHPAIAADLVDPWRPRSAVGFIVEALRLRRQAGMPAVTVLCCDNLPSNGKVVRRLVTDFALAQDPRLASWIEAGVAFPSTMVDRITPASTRATAAEAERLTGFADQASVETEPFTQWIIEDDFTAGRPDWQAGGALFVEDVAPYEKMKLRMLNGAHSMLAYSGFIAGHKYVRDVMADQSLAMLVRRHMAQAARTLDAVPGIDLDHYAGELCARFANPNIAHETYQIAMDGTQKLAQRLIEPAMVALRRGLALDCYAFAVAAWMRYALGRKENGETYRLRDPRDTEIEALLSGAWHDPETIVDRLMALPGLFPDELSSSAAWRQAVMRRLEVMLVQNMHAAIEAEREQLRA